VTVYGFGEKKTPEPFVAACDKFIYTEVLQKEKDEETTQKSLTSRQLKQDTKLVNLVRHAIDAASDESGWAHLAPVGSYIAKQSPEFDPRNYGYRKLGELIEAMKLFEIEERPVGQGQSKAIYIKDTRK
ncbi:MAG: NYN domain-containing protein, partial [Balneolaceae bacterium]